MKIIKKVSNLKFKAIKKLIKRLTMYVFSILCFVVLSSCGTNSDYDSPSILEKYDIEHDPHHIIKNQNANEPELSPTPSDESFPVSLNLDPVSDLEASITPDPEISVTVVPDQNVEPAVTNEPYNSYIPTRVPEDEITDSRYSSYDNTKYSWSFRREKNNIPSGTYEPFKINDYNAFYMNTNVSDDDKVIYLTFDCGYENGYTSSILDTLKKHDAKAMFFVTKQFLKESYDLVIRMKEEGHMVGNHTLNHPSLPTLTIDKLKDEVLGCKEFMKEKTGYDIDMFIRPPMGEYSERTLKILGDLGYTTIFWSIAYLDYDVNKQPGKEYVINHFKEYHHNGAIPLIHNVSQSNAEALDEVLTNLESEGYRLGTLDELLN